LLSAASADYIETLDDSFYTTSPDTTICLLTSFALSGATGLTFGSTCSGNPNQCTTITYSGTTARITNTNGYPLPFTYQNIITVTGGSTTTISGEI
jgi:hypothetical protein